MCGTGVMPTLEKQPLIINLGRSEVNFVNPMSISAVLGEKTDGTNAAVER